MSRLIGNGNDLPARSVAVACGKPVPVVSVDMKPVLNSSLGCVTIFRVCRREELLIMRLTVVTEDEAVVNVDVRLLSCCAWRGIWIIKLLWYLTITSLQCSSRHCSPD